MTARGVVGLILLVAVLGVGGWIVYDRYYRHEGVPVELQHAAVTYDTAAPRREAESKHRVASASKDSARAAIAEMAAAELGAAAARQKQRADSLAALVASQLTAQDSVTTLHGAYVARTSEADTLRLARDSATARADHQEHRADSLSVDLDSARVHLFSADSLRKASIRVVETHDCTLPLTLGRVGCPTRAQSAGLGALAALLLLFHAHQ